MITEARRRDTMRPTEILRVLLAAGADLNVKNNDGKRPRRLAIELYKSGVVGYYKSTARILKDAGTEK